LHRSKRHDQDRENFYAPKPDLSDKIRPEVKLAIKALDGYPSPNGLLYRYEETQVKLDLDKDGTE